MNFQKIEISYHNKSYIFISYPKSDFGCILQSQGVFCIPNFERKIHIPIAKNLSYQTSQFDSTGTNKRVILLKHGKRPSGC